jgi:hypothetical protein
MQVHRDIVVVVFHGTGSIVVNDDKFGPSIRTRKRRCSLRERGQRTPRNRGAG